MNTYSGTSGEAQGLVRHATEATATVTADLVDPADSWQALTAAAAELQATLESAGADTADVVEEMHTLPPMFDAAAATESDLEGALGELRAVAKTAEGATAVLDDATARIADGNASLREALSGFVSAAMARSESIAFDRAGEEEGAALDAAKAALAGVEVMDAAAMVETLRTYGVAVEAAHSSHDAVIAAEEAAAAEAARRAEAARQAEAHQQWRRQTGGATTPRGTGTDTGDGSGGGSSWTPQPSAPYNGGGMGAPAPNNGEQLPPGMNVWL